MVEGFEQAWGCTGGFGGLFWGDGEGSTQKPVYRPRVVVIELTEAVRVHGRILGIL